MKKLIVVAVAFLACPALAGEPKPIRTGWNSMIGAPYGRCMYLEITGPRAARVLILKRAKEQYREADPEALAAVADRVVVRVATLADRTCAAFIPKEVIFVSKKTDAPSLRLDLSTDTAVLQNGFGATWTSTDGVAVVPAEQFKAALSEGKFKVVVVAASGETQEIKSGMGQTTWSGDHTSKVLVP